MNNATEEAFQNNYYGTIYTNRKKKEALINGQPDLLPKLALAYRDRNRNGFEYFQGGFKNLNYPENIDDV